MELIFWSSVTLFVIAAIAVAVMVAKHNRIFKDEDPVHYEPPGRYDDVQYAEQPYCEHFN
jgi:hypothetical protein